MQIFSIVFSNGVARWPRGGGGQPGAAGAAVREEILKVSTLEPQRLIVGLGLFSWDLSARQKVGGGGGVGEVTLWGFVISHDDDDDKEGDSTGRLALDISDTGIFAWERTDGRTGDSGEDLSRRSLTQSPLLQCLVARFFCFFSSPLRATTAPEERRLSSSSAAAYCFRRCSVLLQSGLGVCRVKERKEITGGSGEGGFKN